jgi:hypothetical protein
MFTYPPPIQCRDRTPDWEARYQQVDEDWAQSQSDARTPRWLRYGHRDCATYCAQKVEAVWGVDPMIGLYGGYKSRGEAFKWLRASGLEDLLGRYMRQIEVPMAKRGDVIVYRNSLDHRSQKQGLGVKDHLYLLAPAKHGIVQIIPPQMVAAFTLDWEV